MPKGVSEMSVAVVKKKGGGGCFVREEKLKKAAAGQLTHMYSRLRPMERQEEKKSNLARKAQKDTGRRPEKRVSPWPCA